MSNIYEVIEFVDVTLPKSRAGEISCRPFYKVKLRDSSGSDCIAIGCSLSRSISVGITLNILDTVAVHKSVMFLTDTDIIGLTSADQEIIFGYTGAITTENDCFRYELDDGIRVSSFMSEDFISPGTMGFFKIGNDSFGRRTLKII